MIVRYVVRDEGHCDVTDGNTIYDAAFQQWVKQWLAKGYTVELWEWKEP